MKIEIITINSRKYKGEIDKTWAAKLIGKSTRMIEMVGVFEKEIKHPHLGVIRRNTVSFEFYWLDAWYNIFRFHEPGGDFRNFYCNINMPPTFKEAILDYVDLDIDVLVWRDLKYEILDLDEYEANAIKYAYPNALRRKIESALHQLILMIDNKVFPFDYKF